MSAPRIEKVRRPEATRLRSTLVIPTVAAVLHELVHNALDAGASRVDIWISPGPSVGLRVEDDGLGILARDLPQLAERYNSSKTGDGEHGFRGEALASIAALSLLEITSRVAGEESWAKIIKNGERLYTGPRNLGRTHGTTVVVKDLFNAVPVRLAALGTPATVVARCRRVVEAAALVRPGVRWSVWEERVGGAKSVLSLQSSDTLGTYRALYGHAGVERTQSIRVRAGARRIDGFISLEGAVTRSHQHLYVNGYAFRSGSELHMAVSRSFAASNYSALCASLTDDIGLAAGGARASPRRLERYPIYVLNITLPAPEVDAAYEPAKGVVGYKDAEKVVAFVTAVVDGFLRRHGFGVRREETSSPCKRPSEQTRGTPPKRIVLGVREEAPVAKRLFQSAIERTHQTALGVNGGEKGKDPFATGAWLTNMQGNAHDGVLALPARRTPIPTLPVPAADITFSRETLANPRVLSQVDRKFVPCVLDAPPDPAASTDTTRKVLVVFDQHAADERASLETILDDLCSGFASNSTPTTNPTGLALVLTQREAHVLDSPGVRPVLARWGIELGIPARSEGLDGDMGEYVQVGVIAVPAALERLGKKDGQELTRLLRLYLPVLEEGYGEIQALIATLEAGTLGNGDENGDRNAHGVRQETPSWARIQSWMPREMLELANSKACRGAIMFGTKLDEDQCTRLLSRLDATRNPWICAHGRPTVAPLCVLPGKVSAKREIDWKAWAARKMSDR